MDSRLGVVIGLVSLVSLLLGYKFVADHWQDIKELAVVALVLGGTFTVAVGGLKLKSGR